MVTVIAASLMALVIVGAAVPVAATTGGSVATTTPRYVALGDSVAAGLGLPAAPGSDPVCGVSRQAYGVLVAASLRMPYQNAACSGATAGDLVTEQHLAGTNRDIEPQLDQAFAAGKPALISITAGANDASWAYYINKCLQKTCGTVSDKFSSAALLGALRAKLSYAMRDISNRSNGKPPRVVLTGYYRPFSAACVQQYSGVTAAELAWINKQTAALNKVLIDISDDYSSFVRFAPVSFAGHELCSATPWIQGLRDKAPLHPTYSGQRIISKAVLLQAK